MLCQLGTVVVTLIILCCFLQASATSYTHYRLPTTIQPDLYILKIVTHLEDPANLTFNGQVSIRFNVLEDTSNITLHVQNLTIDDSNITLKSYGDEKFRFCGRGIETVPEQDYYVIRLCEPLLKGQMYKVKLYFSGILNEELQGYYRSSYVVKETNETRWLSVTQFEPTFARAAFPCLDEPIYKAKFIIWLGHHKSLTALSNMPLEKQIPVNDVENFVWSAFEESVPMSTYLVAFTINDFSYKSSKSVQGSKVTFRTWFRKEALDQCDYAAEVGPKVLKYYEEVFGVPFPLPKVDAIAIPDFSAGAMENWGLITYTETALLFAPNISSEFSKQRIVSVIAHELAHQWFGNLVTMKWWTDLWLNEGFATYIASLGVYNLNPEWDSYNDESLANMLTIFRIDAQLSSHPISQPILDSSQIGERFDSISYNKGSGILRMTHMILGQDGFFEAVREYLKNHEYKNAEQDDLWAAFTETAHKYGHIESQYDMKDIMDSWTLQSGYPLVKVNRDYKTGSVEITQHRYLEISDIRDDKCWWVPLSYTTASKLNFMTTTPKAWLECDGSNKSVTLKLENVAKANEWIIFNIQLSGVYKVMYDPENWRLLNETLNSDKFTSIHVMNRAQLIDDAIWLAWSGYQNYDVTFDVLDYLIEEREYLPWSTALGGINNVEQLLRTFEQHHAYFKAYLRHIIEPVYNYLDGLNDSNDDSSSMHTRLLHKSIVTGWACYLELEDCIKSAINYFQQWRTTENPSTQNIIPVDLRTTVYCTAIRHGDIDDWQFLWKRYKESNVASEKISILASLSCSGNDKILRDYIDMVFDKKKHSYIHKHHAAYALSTVAASKAGASLAMDYFLDNISDLYELYGPYSSVLDEVLEIVASQIISIKDLTKLTNIIDTHKDYFSKSKTLVQSVFETINFNIKWIEHNVQDMKFRLQSRLSRMGVL